MGSCFLSSRHSTRYTDTHQVCRDNSKHGGQMYSGSRLDHEYHLAAAARSFYYQATGHGLRLEPPTFLVIDSAAGCL